MERSKLKNVIILLLLVLNLCLLLLAAGRYWQGKEAEEQLRQNTVLFLKKNGISVLEDQIPWDEPGSVQMTERSSQEERRLAETILGTISDNSTGIASEYIGEKGSVRFYPDGRFYLSFQEKSMDKTVDMEHYAQRYLKKLGFEVEKVSSETEGEQTKLVFLQLAEGVPVFTCKIEVVYQKEALSQIQGWRLQGEVQPSNKQQESLTTPTLLVRFVSEMKQNGFFCSEIRSITQGYVYSTGGLSSQSNLLPVWRIETDQKTHLLNCVTGKLESADQWLH